MEQKVEIISIVDFSCGGEIKNGHGTGSEARVLGGSLLERSARVFCSGFEDEGHSNWFASPF
jgi:hypothetical protein